MASKNHNAITSSINPLWRTPRWLVAALDREFRILLDCAASEEDRTTTYFLGPGSSILDDALCGVSWWDAAASVYTDPVERGALFVNPPYSQDLHLPIAPWIRQAAIEGQCGTVIGIVPLSPQTEWWRTYVESTGAYRATEVRKFPFRLKFEPPADYVGKAPGANVNTAVVIWKPTAEYQTGPWAPLCRYWVPDEYPGRRVAVPPGVAGY